MKKGLAVAVFDAAFGPVVYTGANEKEWDEMFGRTAAAGYNGVDLFIDEKNERELCQIKRLLEKHKLGVGLVVCICLKDQGVNFSSPDEKIRKRSVDIYCQEIKKASIFAPCAMPIGIIRGAVSEGETLEDNLKHLAESMHALERCAVSSGIRLCIEPMNRFEANTLLNVPETMAFIEKYELSETYILPDLFHMNIEDKNPADVLRLAGPLIGHMHVADSNRRAPGMGHINYDEVLKALKEIGYDGYVSVEAMPFGDRDGCARQGATYLEQKMKAVGLDQVL